MSELAHSDIAFCRGMKVLIVYNFGLGYKSVYLTRIDLRVVMQDRPVILIVRQIAFDRYCLNFKVLPALNDVILEVIPKIRALFYNFFRTFSELFLNYSCTISELFYKFKWRSKYLLRLDHTVPGNR